MITSVYLSAQKITKQSQTSSGSNSWGGWNLLGRTQNTNLSAAINPDGRLEIFAIAETASDGDAGTNDKFGIKKIYPTKPGGEEWYMNMQNPENDPQFYSGGVPLTRNPDGYSYKATATSVYT